MTSTKQANATRARTTDRSVCAVRAASNAIRSTYPLSAMTFAPGALATRSWMAMSLTLPGLILTLAGHFGLLSLPAKYRELRS
jgi:hypothetical protein